jgi:cyclase
VEQTQHCIATPFFNLERIADGVYAAVAISGKGAWSNAGFVDVGDELFVFDAFSTPKAARELRRMAEELTQKPVKYLVNSHYHGDHTFGNVAFEDVVIISTALTRDLHDQRNRVGDVEKEREEMAKYLQNLQEQIDVESNPVRVLSLTRQLEEMTQVMESLDEMKHGLPTLIFEDKLVFHGSKRTVELYCFGGGHTESDAFVYLPQEKIAFLGDLVTEEVHAPIFDPEAFIANLERIQTFDIDVVIPGHGNVGDRKQILVMNEYLHDLMNLVQSALQNGVTLEQLLVQGAPEKYSHWTGPNGDKRNITTVYNHLVRAQTLSK